MNNNRNSRGRRPWDRQNRNGRGYGGRHSGYSGPRNHTGQRNFDHERRDSNKHDSFAYKSWKRELPTKRLTEDEIGVTEYISDHKGFNGIIKSRFSDFQVSEINEAGEVAKLTNFSPPEIPKEEGVNEDEDLLFNKYNLEILPMETWDKINKLISDPESKGEKVEVDVTGMSKEQRTKIHEAVKKAFGDCIVGSTVTVDDKKFVKFDKYRKGVRIDNRVKWIWPGEYVYFVLYKENCDTMEAATRIAERLRMNIKGSMIGYAGTKDRRAKTSQWLSVRRVDPHRVAAAAAALSPLRLGDYRFASVPLRLGMLQGNRFRICLRNVTASDEEVEEACALLRDNGFINYYGLQRFGSRAEAPTYSIGLKLLQGKFQEAINSILQERMGPLADVLRTYARAGAAAALALLTPPLARTHPAEASLLRALAMRPNDLLGAMSKISRNSRLLYLHAMQSLVWNRAASERLRRGRHPQPGDLVPDERASGVMCENSDDESDNDELETERSTTETVDENTIQPKNDKKDDIEDKKEENSINHDDKKDNIIEEDKTDRDIKKKSKREPKELISVKVLTEEDIDSGKYTMSDVVLPLPGYKVQYPPNMKDFYEEVLAKDGLKLDMQHKYKSYSLSGGYRPVVVRPTDVQWRTVRYSEPYCDLILSDADEMDGRTTTGEDQNGKYKALLLTMNLASSCYATMALRELMKVDTSSESQAQQNNYHRASSVRDTITDKGGDRDTDKASDNTENDNDDGAEMETDTSGNTAEKRKLSVEEANSKKIKTSD